MKNLAFSLSIFLFVFCSGNHKSEKDKTGISIQRIIKIKGSETVRNIIEKFMDGYKEENPEVMIDYSGGGSVIGLMAFNAHEADIALISKELLPDELTKLKELNAVFDTLAIDGLSIVTHINNSVKQLSINQLSDIYSGKIKNWKEVGGEDYPITVYSRDISSGTYSFFKDKVLGKEEYTTNDINLTHNEEIVNNVASTKNAIGYVGLSYTHNPNLKILPIVFNDGEPAFFPNYQNIKSNNYLLKRYILMLTNPNSDDHVKKVMLSLGSEGTFKIINESGLIPYKNHYN